jgi:hypothetical protein
MAKKDLKSLINGVEVFASAAPGTSAVEGADVDLQGFESCTFLLSAVASSAGTYRVMESDTAGSGYTAAVAADVLGALASALVVGSINKIGYIGSKRYATIELDLSVDGVCAVIGVRGHARINEVV